MDRKKSGKWIDQLCEAITGGLEFQDGLSLIESSYTPPEDSVFGTHHLELAPAWMEMADGGAEDGELVWGLIWDWDLLHMQAAFDELDAFSYSHMDGRPRFTLEGKFQDKDVVVEIFTEPFEDSEVGGYFENGGMTVAG